MKLDEFKPGVWRKGYEYQYFLPEPINHEFIINDSKTQELLERASIKLGELNAFARLVPDIDLFIRPYVMKEAVNASVKTILPCIGRKPGWRRHSLPSARTRAPSPAAIFIQSKFLYTTFIFALMP